MINVSNRPKNLEELIGCNDIKSAVKIALVASKSKNEEFPHTLIYGGPGLGKSTLSNIIARERGGDFKSFLSEVFKKKDDVRNLLASLNSEGYDEDGNIIGPIKPTTVFLDEIHQLSKKVQEGFFQAMEDLVYTFSDKNKYNGKEEKVTFWVPRFTLIGATTKPGELEQPFIDRFKLTFTLRLYSNQEICEIIDRYCKSKLITIEDEAIVKIANRSRGVARKCINFIERCVDTSVFIDGVDNIRITPLIVEETFKILNIDPNGLDLLDLQILQYLYKIYPQKVGIARIAGIVNISEIALKEIVEPYLLRQGFIEATPSGRIISEDGMNYLEKNNLIQKGSSSSRYGGKVTNG